MRLSNHIHLFSVVMIVIVSTMAAGAAPVSVAARVNNDTVRIGDTFRYTVEVEWDSSVTIRETGTGETFGDFEIRKLLPAVDTQVSKTRKKRVYSYDLAGYKTGEFEIPPYTLYYREGGGEDKEVSSPTVKVTVTSVLPASTENLDIRPLKPPLDIAPDYTTLYFVSGICVAVIFLLVISYLLWRKYIRKKPQSDEVSRVPLRPPEEVAREALEALRNSPLPMEGKIKEYYSEVADTIRVYLGRRYSINAIDMTSFELLVAMGDMDPRKRPPDDIFRDIESLLEESDLVKFAKFIPTTKRWDIVIDDALDIVDKTTHARSRVPEAAGEVESKT